MTASNGKVKVIVILATALWTILIGVGSWEIHARMSSDEASIQYHTRASERVAAIEAHYDEIKKDLDEIKTELRDLRREVVKRR